MNNNKLIQLLNKKFPFEPTTQQSEVIHQLSEFVENSSSNYNVQRDQDGNFIPPREGYINDVVVEGQVVVKSSILVTDANNRKRKYPALRQNGKD